MLDNLDDLNYGRRDFGCNVIDDKIVIFGGVAYGKSTEVLDLNGDRLWRTTQTSNLHHYSPKLIKANNVLYRVAGGQNDNKVYSFNGYSWNLKFNLAYQSLERIQFGVIRLPVEFLKQGC